MTGLLNALTRILLCGILFTTLEARAVVHQWGEAAGFDEFGIGTPTIILEQRDTLNCSTHLGIGTGDFIVAVNATASPTRPWGLTLTGISNGQQPGSVTFLSMIHNTISAFDDVESYRIIMVKQTIGNRADTTVIRCKDGIWKRYPATQSMVIERHDNAWTVTLKPDNAKAETYAATIKNPDFAIETFGITVPEATPWRKGGFGKQSGNVEIHRATAHYTPAPPMASLTTIDALTSYFLRSTDPVEGYYRISERSLDEQYLRPGGDYVLAMLRTTDGSYNIIYISGATQLPSAWKTGMVHGRATPTADPMQYTATWIDARHRPISGEILMTIDGTGILTIQFPYMFSIVRLRRLDPTSIHP